MWHLYSWTSMTEKTNWSTAGFSLQHQSLNNQTSNENYGNHPLKDFDLMYQQILKTLMSTKEGQWRRINSLDTENGEGYNMSDQINLLLCKAKKNKINPSLPYRQSALKFCLLHVWTSFSVLIFLFSWSTTCTGTWPLGKWEWKGTFMVANLLVPDN